MAKVKIRIPVLVGSNGLWHSFGYGDVGKETPDSQYPDWSTMEDGIMQKGDDGLWHDPDVSTKIFVEAEIEVPDIKAIYATGVVEE